MRWFIGTMMYVTRVISDGDLDKILPHLLPTTPGVIDSSTAKTFIKRMVLELQRDICHTHERVARAWLNSLKGQEFLKLQKSLQLVATPP
jgi:HSP90 family molecular chaperone